MILINGNINFQTKQTEEKNRFLISEHSMNTVKGEKEVFLHAVLSYLQMQALFIYIKVILISEVELRVQGTTKTSQ